MKKICRTKKYNDTLKEIENEFQKKKIKFYYKGLKKIEKGYQQNIMFMTDRAGG